jgi:hypothetical protein
MSSHPRRSKYTSLHNRRSNYTSLHPRRSNYTSSITDDRTNHHTPEDRNTRNYITEDRTTCHHIPEDRTNIHYSWFQTVAVFWMCYAFFWVIPWRLNFICRPFGTLCPFHLHRQVGVKMERTECSEKLAYKIQTPRNYTEESIHHSEHGESLKSSTVMSVIRSTMN